MTRIPGYPRVLVSISRQKGLNPAIQTWSSYCSGFLNSGFTVPWCVAMSPVHLKRYICIYIYMIYMSYYWYTRIVCIYVYMYIYIWFMYIYMYIYIYIFKYVHTNIYIYIYICTNSLLTNQLIKHRPRKLLYALGTEGLHVPCRIATQMTAESWDIFQGRFRHMMGTSYIIYDMDSNGL